MIVLSSSHHRKLVHRKFRIKIKTSISKVRFNNSMRNKRWTLAACSKKWPFTSLESITGTMVDARCSNDEMPKDFHRPGW